MARTKKRHILRNVLLVIGGVFFALAMIAIFAPEVSLDKKPAQTVAEAGNEKQVPFFYSVLTDANFPKLYGSTLDDFIVYFDKIERKNWLQYEYAGNEETSHFYITEKRAGLAFEKHIASVSITDKDGEVFPNMTLYEAAIIAESFLPSTMPPVKKTYSGKVENEVTWEKTLENIYFIPGSDYLETKNQIIYTSKFESITRSPDGRFYTAITIGIAENQIKIITMGGMQYDPPRLQKTFRLKRDIIQDFNAIIEILNNGVEAEGFIKYQL